MSDIVYTMHMQKRIEWSDEKNAFLLAERGISFEDVATLWESDDVIEFIPHENKKKYPHQFVAIVRIKQYIYRVPYVEDEEKIFLKTIIPSRIHYKKYISNL